MKALLPLVAVAVSLTSASQPSADIHHLRGVPPTHQELYQPTANSQWKCLNTSQVIPYSAINDDYCDCDDGSDEPATSACSGLARSTTSFWCENVGHIPGFVKSGRVNDGICDPECCDGSDEYNGITTCPNTCAKVGREYRKRLQEEANIRSAGAKIRASYIAETAKKLSALRAEVASLEVEVEVAREQEAAKKAEFERAEKMDQAIIEEKKQTPLYATLKDHQSALDALVKREEAMQMELKKLTDLLDDLSDGYNPNYQDMAVKGAVMAYRSWRKGGDGNEQEEEEGEAAGEEKKDDAPASPINIKAQENVKLKELYNQGEWTSSKLLEMVRKETLELMDDSYFKSSVLDSSDHENILFRIHEYLPEPLVPLIDQVVDSLLDILIKTNIISGVKRRRSSSTKSDSSSEPENVTAARRAHSDASAHTRSLSSDLSNKRASLNNDPARFGREAEWKALEGKCIEKNMGEYTYEYCFFGGTMQKPNKGGSNVSLGRFGSFEPLDETLTPQDEGYFARQKYVNGQRCWNGPDRSVIVDVVCGVENELLDVFEAEKCIYSMKISTPAVCYPQVDGSSSSSSSSSRKEGVKDEL